jgi:hypothetical protein
MLNLLEFIVILVDYHRGKNQINMRLLHELIISLTCMISVQLNMYTIEIGYIYQSYLENHIVFGP